VESKAELTGKLMFSATSNLDLPTVGDWVYAQYYDASNYAIICEILPRKSILKRRSAGRRIEFQLIACNIDVAFIVQSLDENFNLRRIERYLVLANDSNIKPAILLSKLDLISSRNLEEKIGAIQKLNGNYDIFAFSNQTGAGLGEIKKYIKSGVTYCLLGSSGVGKTTLLNSLLGENKFATGVVRAKDSKGRHITARRQLSILDQGGLIIDTPGMRELGIMGGYAGIRTTFEDIDYKARACRFKNCTHLNEPGCAVLEAVANGSLNKKRYQNYLRILRESEYYEMSYLAKRKKDKDFGKMVKKMKKVMKKQSGQ